MILYNLIALNKALFVTTLITQSMNEHGRKSPHWIMETKLQHMHLAIEFVFYIYIYIVFTYCTYYKPKPKCSSHSGSDTLIKQNWVLEHLFLCSYKYNIDILYNNNSSNIDFLPIFKSSLKTL